jgi:uncharacterized protein (DUF2336 family)
MITEQSLITELESALETGSEQRRVDTLRRITDLFVADSMRLSDSQVDLFNDVLQHLVKRIEGKALMELSERLAPINNAPAGVVRRLAGDDNIAIAGPVLSHSIRLSDKDLIEIANRKSQAHLLAISGRPQIHTTVTDALLQRGDRQVFHRLAENYGAGFSEHGFATLVHHSASDDHLAEKVGLRRDLPPPLFRELLARATEVVRSRLINTAVPEARQRIQKVLASIAEDEQHQAGFDNEHDYADAHTRALAKQAKRELDEAAVADAAKADRYADMIAALSLLCGAPMPLVENLLQGKHNEAFLIPCKAAGLQWATVRLLLTCKSIGRNMSSDDLEATRADYFRLSQTAAGRVLRFWQVRQAAAKDAPELQKPGANAPGPAIGPAPAGLAAAAPAKPAAPTFGRASRSRG